MNFDWTEDEQRQRDEVASVLAEGPGEADRSSLGSLEIARPDEIRQTILTWMERLGPTGYLSMGVEPGDMGEVVRLVAGQEVVANASGALFLAVEASVRLMAGLVAGAGGDAPLAELRDALRAGKILGAVALAPGVAEGGEQVDVIATGRDEGFVLSGRKGFVTNGPVADWVAVSADLDGTTVVALLPIASPGLIRGPRLETLGLRGLAVCGLELDECPVDSEHLLGLHGGVDLEPLRRLEDLILSVASLGVMYRALEAAKAHASEHQRGEKPLMGYQEIRFKLAEMLTLYQTAQLYVYRAAYLLSEADPSARVGSPGADATTVLRAAKVFAAEAAQGLATEAAQILAGRGYVSGNPVEQAYRDAKYFGLAGTTTEVARMAIAQELLARDPV